MQTIISIVLVALIVLVFWIGSAPVKATQPAAKARKRQLEYKKCARCGNKYKGLQGLGIHKTKTHQKITHNY